MVNEYDENQTMIDPENAADTAEETLESAAEAEGEVDSVIEETGENLTETYAEADSVGTSASESTDAASFISGVLTGLAHGAAIKSSKEEAEKEASRAKDALSTFAEELENGVQEKIRIERDAIRAGGEAKKKEAQDKIKAVQEEKEKARQEAIEALVKAAIAPMEEENASLGEQLNALYTDNSVPKLLRNHAASALFFPKGILDWVEIGVAAAVTMFVVPLCVILALQTHPVLLSFVLFIWYAAIFCLYQSIFRRKMMDNRGVHKAAEEIRVKIRENKKEASKAATAVKTSKDENQVDLSAFDARISDIEGDLKELVADNQALMEEFESDKVPAIRTEIEEAKAAEKASLEDAVSAAEENLKALTEEYAAFEETKARDYVPVLGAENLNETFLNALRDYVQANPDQTLAQAIAALKEKEQ